MNSNFPYHMFTERIQPHSVSPPGFSAGAGVGVEGRSKPQENISRSAMSLPLSLSSPSSSSVVVTNATGTSSPSSPSVMALSQEKGGGGGGGGKEEAGKQNEKQGSAIATLAPLTAAAVSTAALMYPVDVLRALSMANAGGGEKFSIGDFYRKYGMKGFVSQGVVPEIVKSSVMRVSKFFFFPVMCDSLFGKNPKNASPIEKGLAGAMATVPEILMISPLEVAKIGLQVDHENKFKNNSVEFAKHIFKTRGFSGLYCGWAGMQWRQSFWTGTYFATLSWWKQQVEPVCLNIGAPQPVAQFISGFLAGCFAVIPNAPGDVVRSVVQKEAFNNPNRQTYGIGVGGIIEHFKMASEIAASRGILGLWAGFGFKAMHLGGSGALMAMFIPMFSKLMGINYSGV